MRTTLFKLGLCLIPAILGLTPAAPTMAEQNKEKQMHNDQQRGRYLLVVGGCNDCHSPGYAESGGNLPTAQWLTGSGIGFQGPWGTTYPGNLRNLVASLSEDQWLAKARAPMRPPMPSPSLIAMSDQDLRAVYRYIRRLGPEGIAAPTYVPPGQPVSTPFINFMPVTQP